MFETKVLISKNSSDYELLDSGLEEKLERYGKYILRRPDPQALWSKKLTDSFWKEAHAEFERSSKNAGWRFKKNIPEKWQIEFGGLKFWIRPSTFKHTGIFPEQKSNWEWMQKLIRESKREISVLNLFGYTGGATLAAAAAGAKVCHVDGSKVAIGWAKDNAEISGLGKKPISWILDDAAKFVAREVKRGNKYEGIILDPPAFGHGPKNELWKIEQSLLPLLQDCFKILSASPLFFLVNGYASGYSSIAYANNLEELKNTHNGEIEKGELTLQEEGSGRLLPCGIFARWSANK